MDRRTDAEPEDGPSRAKQGQQSRSTKKKKGGKILILCCLYVKKTKVVKTERTDIVSRLRPTTVVTRSRSLLQLIA